MKWNIIVIFAFALSLILLGNECDGKVSYNGSQVWRIVIKSRNYLAWNGKIIVTMVDIFNLDVWSETKTHIDVRIDPIDQVSIRETFSSHNIEYSILIEDLGIILQREDDLLKNDNSRAFNVSGFNTFEDIESFLSDVATSNPDASLTSIGTTLEGRNLWQLKFSVGPGKPAVWIDCGIHAREWITESTCLWGIDFINQNYGIDADVTMLLDSYDLYILSVVNPDGYSYTWTDDRLWRKNRNPNDGDCYGIDLNRNFNDGQWETLVGASNDMCAPTYHGSSPASELEIEAVQNSITDLYTNENLQMMFSIHSYSQYWMYPYAYTNNSAPNVDVLDSIAKKGVEALTSVYGTPYTYGPWYSVLYPSSGTTLDFAYALGISKSFTIELRPHRAITGGFQISADEIIPTAIETWTGLFAAILDK